MQPKFVQPDFANSADDGTVEKRAAAANLQDSRFAVIGLNIPDFDDLAANVIARTSALATERQNTQRTNNGPFSAKTVEGTHDRAEMQLQEQSDRLRRAIVALASDGPIDMVVPPAGIHKDALAQWDPSTGVLGASSTTVADFEARVAAASGAAVVGS